MSISHKLEEQSDYLFIFLYQIAILQSFGGKCMLPFTKGYRVQHSVNETLRIIHFTDLN